MTQIKLPGILLTGALACALAGCVQPERVDPFPPTPLSQASRIVNRNIERIEGTLRAVGPVDGYVTTEDGRRHGFHLDGTLFYLAPTYLRFDLKKLGETQLLLGSNRDYYWFFAKEDETHQCARHGAGDDLSLKMPVKPHELIDALGLTPIPTGEPAPGVIGCAQRIVDEHQQVLFLADGGDAGVILTKEYWLDRYSPRLTRRVVFRDADGAVKMDSQLADYRRLGTDGPWLPRELIADWPETQTRLRFRIRKWTLVPQVGPGGVQFATPRDCQAR